MVATTVDPWAPWWVGATAARMVVTMAARTVVMWVACWDNLMADPTVVVMVAMRVVSMAPMSVVLTAVRMAGYSVDYSVGATVVRKAHSKAGRWADW